MRNKRRRPGILRSLLLLAAVLAAQVLPGCPGLKAEAKEKDVYTYQAVFHAGIQGTFRGTDEVKITEAEGIDRAESPRIVLSADRKTITVTGLYPGDKVAFDVALMDTETGTGAGNGTEDGTEPGTGTVSGSDIEPGSGTVSGSDAEPGTGTVSGSDIEQGADLPSGPIVESTLAVELADGSRYYIKGLLKSGRDGSDALDAALPAEGVTEDLDYVVSYGIRGDMTTYRVNYRDEDGRQLAPSRTYSGNVGDRPVAAYLYISGYRPQAYNLTKTLSRNEAENEMTFTYVTAREQGGYRGRGDGTTVTGTGEVTEEIVVTEGTTAVIPGEGGEASQPGAGTEELTEELEDEPVPLDLLDLDDEETPLAGLGSGENGAGADSGSMMYFLGAIAFIGIAALAGFGLWIFMKRKKKETA